MEVKGAKKLVIWNDENVRITLENNEKRERLAKTKTVYPKSPGEVYFKDDILVASRDERSVSLEER